MVGIKFTRYTKTSQPVTSAMDVCFTLFEPTSTKQVLKLSQRNWFTVDFLMKLVTHTSLRLKPLHIIRLMANIPIQLLLSRSLIRPRKLFQLPLYRKVKFFSFIIDIVPPVLSFFYCLSTIFFSVITIPVSLNITRWCITYIFIF